MEVKHSVTPELAEKFDAVFVMTGGSKALEVYLAQHPDVIVVPGHEIDECIKEHSNLRPLHKKYEVLLSAAHQCGKQVVLVLHQADPSYHVTCPPMLREVVREDRVCLLFRNPVERVLRHVVHAIYVTMGDFRFHAAGLWWPSRTGEPLLLPGEVTGPPREWDTREFTARIPDARELFQALRQNLDIFDVTFAWRQYLDTFGFVTVLNLALLWDVPHGMSRIFSYLGLPHHPAAMEVGRLIHSIDTRYLMYNEISFRIGRLSGQELIARFDYPGRTRVQRYLEWIELSGPEYCLQNDGPGHVGWQSNSFALNVEPFSYYNLPRVVRDFLHKEDVLPQVAAQLAPILDANANAIEEAIVPYLPTAVPPEVLREMKDRYAKGFGELVRAHEDELGSWDLSALWSATAADV